MKLWKWLVLGVVILIMGLGAYAYLVVLSPVFVQKPPIVNPLASDTLLVFENATAVINTTQIKKEHVEFLVNEIGAYKLHDDPATKTPARIEIVVVDSGITYTATIVDNYPEVKQESAQNPDVRLHTSQMQLILLLQAEDFEQTVVDKALAGDIQVELLVDEKTLALKGYKGIYDTLNKQADIPISGNVIAALDADWWDILKSRQMTSIKA